MADAKYSGAVGVVTSTQGPGAMHLINGLYDAKLDSVPVVALVAQQHTSVLGSGYQQEINLGDVFSDVAGPYMQTVASAEQVPFVLDRAFRSALTHRTPVVVLTTTDDKVEIQRCYDLGCNVYITKPVNYESFAQAIRQLGLFLSVIQVPEVEEH